MTVTLEEIVKLTPKQVLNLFYADIQDGPQGTYEMNLSVELVEAMLHRMHEFNLKPEVFAYHPNASADVLRVLSYTFDTQTLRVIAEHPKTPVDVLSRLAKGVSSYSSPVVDDAIAANPNTPGDAFSILFREGNTSTVRKAIANPGCPDYVWREALLSSESARFIELFLEQEQRVNEHLLEEMIKYGTYDCVKIALKHPLTPFSLIIEQWHEDSVFEKHAEEVLMGSRFNDFHEYVFETCGISLKDLPEGWRLKAVASLKQENYPY